MTVRACAQHEEHPAIAICTACDADICAACHRATITGYAVCADCERKLRAAFLPAWEAARGVGELINGFGTSAVRAMTSTRAFFTRMPSGGSWVRPAVFGVIAHAIGMTAQFLWGWLFIPDFAEKLAEQSTIGTVTPEVATVLLMLAVPFAAPIVLGIHVVLLQLALRTFGAMSRWTTVIRIAGYSSAAHLLQIIPPLGDFPLGYMLAIVWLVNLELLAVRRFFPELSVWRAMGAVFLPFLALSMLGM